MENIYCYGSFLAFELGPAKAITDILLSKQQTIYLQVKRSSE